jgi:hypothetical protein
VALPENRNEAVRVIPSGDRLQPGAGDISPVLADGSSHLPQLLFHQHGRSYLHKRHTGLQPGEVCFAFLAREAALGDLHPVVLVNEDGNALDVGSEGLVPAQDE